jgi:hypothetical protein
MARLAIISSAVDREVLEAMNPARPPPPEEVEEPSTLNLDADFRAQSWRMQLTEVKTQDERVSLEKRIFQREEQLRAELRPRSRPTCSIAPTSTPGEFRRRALSRAQAERDGPQSRTARPAAMRPAQRPLRSASGRSRLRRPIARRSSAGRDRQRVAYYFSSRADTPYAHASSLPDLQDGIPVVQALSLAGKTEEAWRALRSDLGSALFRLELHHEWLALFRAFFPAKYTKLSCAPASSPLNWRTRMRIPILLAFVALALSGCNANQAINPSGEANLCAHDPSCNPYNPSSYAQNNVGIGR